MATYFMIMDSAIPPEVIECDGVGCYVRPVCTTWDHTFTDHDIGNMILAAVPDVWCVRVMSTYPTNDDITVAVSDRYGHPSTPGIKAQVMARVIVGRVPDGRTCHLRGLRLT